MDRIKLIAESLASTVELTVRTENGRAGLTVKIEYPLELQKKHIDIYLKHFKKPLLCINY